MWNNVLLGEIKIIVLNDIVFKLREKNDNIEVYFVFFKGFMVINYGFIVNFL